MSTRDVTPWHSVSLEEIATALATDPSRGLSRAEAAMRLGRDGPNWLLIVGAVVAVALGEWIDGGAILTIVALNAVIGFFQEYRAERAVAALARLTAPRARVVRDGHSELVAAKEVVRGDLLVLDAGDLVAADARLVEFSLLRVNEAPLTGESEPVEKSDQLLPPEAALGDRRNEVFLGTSVSNGSGRALVVATGMGTEVGHIAGLLASPTDDQTPLQKRLEVVGRQLLWSCLAVVGLVSALGWLRGTATLELFIGAVSLAVAAVPEGLPAVVTVALALGVERMARRNALVRRLPSVETLGSTQVICTDKTGTLTVGQMTVRRLLMADAVFRVTGEGYGVAGQIFGDDERHAQQQPRDLLWAAAACNDAEIAPQGESFRSAGDSTEVALLVAAAKLGIRREGIEAGEPRIRTLPFDSDRKRMSVVRFRVGEPVAYVKGAPEGVLERCSHVRTSRGVVSLDAETRARLDQAIAQFAAEALRVLAIAERTISDDSLEDIETSLTLLGFAGLQDPPRAEARDAVARCRRAGIRTVMITGDHPATARAIAAELGILGADDEVLVGAELEALSLDALRERVARVAVYARVTAEQKLRIVHAWKARGAIVAMTGDGVNDAPALREASIGIAMGISGTEVAKEASDMVIADDNFASIVAAVEEGRGIFDNVSKTLSYLLAGNLGELALMLTAGLAGLPVPLLPVQLLWINLVTDGLPALALATDPIDPGVMRRPPRPASAQLADGAALRGLLLTGALTAAVAFAAYWFALRGGSDVEAARNAAFSTLVFAELLRSFGARSATRLVHEIGLFSNLRLFAIVTASFLLQLAIHHEAHLARLFGTSPLSLSQCAAQIALACIPLLVLELRKGISRRSGRRPGIRTALAPDLPH
ncbi:MAG: cation-translocating P-type ATPase [Proteobacteria bacterium]|nr:MAG: cation-translocating P-type ATPase [Pseudomonadota bacterium]